MSLTKLVDLPITNRLKMIFVTGFASVLAGAKGNVESVELGDEVIMVYSARVIGSDSVDFDVMIGGNFKALGTFLCDVPGSAGYGGVSMYKEALNLSGQIDGFTVPEVGIPFVAPIEVLTSIQEDTNAQLAFRIKNDDGGHATGTGVAVILIAEYGKQP